MVRPDKHRLQADATDGCDGGEYNLPRDARDTHAFAQWLARRFAGTVGAYEPWNEGNIASFGGQTSDQLGAHQKAAFLGFKSAASATARSSEPPPFVCNNVIAGAGTNLTANVTLRNGLGPYIESFNIHTYNSVEQYPSLFGPAREVATHASASAGQRPVRIPLWLTECGIHLPASTAAPWSDMTAADDLRQADFVAPSYASSFYAGVDKHFFFVLSNYLERSWSAGSSTGSSGTTRRRGRHSRRLRRSATSSATPLSSALSQMAMLSTWQRRSPARPRVHGQIPALLSHLLRRTTRMLQIYPRPPQLLTH